MVSKRVKFALTWHRAGLGARISVFVLALLLVAGLIYFQKPPENSAYLESNLLIFVFINLIAATLCILAFLIGRNVVKLVFDRRRKILGSKLRSKLVGAFVGLTLVPTVILFIFASDLLSRALEGWFSNQVNMAVSGALEVGKQHYELLKNSVLKDAQSFGDKVFERFAASGDEAQLRALLEEFRREGQYFSVQLADKDGQVVAAASHPAAKIEGFSEPQISRGEIQRALAGVPHAAPADTESNRFIRAYVPTRFLGRDVALVVSSRVSSELVDALNQVNESYQEYQQLSLFKNPLRSGPILLLSLITGLLIFSAIWIGFYMAREISVPIQKLAEGTEAVAKGNYNFQIRVGGDDEIGLLVDSFNRMLSDLKSSRELGERRKVFIETILANLAVGVIAVDTRHAVTTVNSAALRLLEISSAEAVQGRDIAEVLGGQSLAKIRPLLESIEGGSESASLLDDTMKIMSAGRELTVVCTAGRLLDSDGKWLGTVFLFDDVTDLSKAQAMAAWREVARRIAHEIKNPLTPIQLAAQRLQRLMADSAQGKDIQESTQMIVEQVDSIKRLANEFSNFARMPTAEIKSTNLNNLVSETIAPIASTTPSIVFQCIVDSAMPEVALDPEQMRRVILNIVDNAVGAISKEMLQGGMAPGTGRISVRTFFDPRKKTAGFEIADNGPGIPSASKSRIFEPYFTTKKGGTGLGLAIVTTIIADHQGDIRVDDNKPCGARFAVELPIAHKSPAARRLAESAAT